MAQGVGVGFPLGSPGSSHSPETSRSGELGTELDRWPLNRWTMTRWPLSRWPPAGVWLMIECFYLFFSYIIIFGHFKTKSKDHMLFHLFILSDCFLKLFYLRRNKCNLIKHICTCYIQYVVSCIIISYRLCIKIHEFFYLVFIFGKNKNKNIWRRVFTASFILKSQTGSSSSVGWSVGALRV